jgi:hypothetical protein
MWLQTPMPMELRPDKCGVILETRSTKLGAETIIARETRAGGVAAMWEFIAKMSDATGFPAYVILLSGERRIIRKEGVLP